MAAIAQSGRRRGVAVAAVVLASWAGCNLEPFHLGAAGDGGVVDPNADAAVGTDDAGVGAGDGGGVQDGAPPPDGCIPSLELCDGVDNNCDGTIDEGFNLMQDPGNCGACGNACVQTSAAGTCNMGMCEYACQPGFHDNDGDLGQSGGTGCEYGPCFDTNGGVEICDFNDNDCNGLVDEGVDTTSDPDNCGGCGMKCIAVHAPPSCTASVCGHAGCDPGFADLQAGILGCEYQCPVDPAVAETCNNVDDDCDGTVDELPIAGLGVSCTDPGFELIGDTGECTFGVTDCSFGTPFCNGYVRPSGEICDNLDNDCDGTIDNGFDKQNNPAICGDCTPCSLPNAIEGCALGLCTVLACEIGFVDLDGLPGNGCELACTPTGPEVCDGVDNDCDLLVDDADPDLVAPANFCTTVTECAGTVPQCTASACDATVTWRCLYGGATEADMCGDLPVDEAICDNIDGDCDGLVDEPFGVKGPCDDGGIGACKGTGDMQCNAMGTALECVITTPGDPAPPMVELACDGIDDDCNGLVDDGAPDDTVHIITGPPLNLDFWIYTYEAARPDATAVDFGVSSARSCSKPGVLPWRSATWTDANAACTAAGRRLCTEVEWQAACEGVAGNIYPYGNTYDPLACNGNDYDPGCVGDDDDLAQPTGSAYGCPPTVPLCVSDDAAFDMSGNLKEWTSTQISVGPSTRRVRGGAFDSVAEGLTCQLAFIAAAEDFAFPNLGFRCCSDTGP